MKKRITTLVLALAMLFSVPIPVAAAGYSITLKYNGTDYTVTTLFGSDITGSTSIGNIISGLKSDSQLHDGNANYVPRVDNPLLYCNGKLIAEAKSDTSQGENYNSTLSNLSVKSGDTIQLYDFGNSYVNVVFEGKEYPVKIAGSPVGVGDLKAAIEASAEIKEANGGTPITDGQEDEDKQLLYDNSGNYLTTVSVSSGSKVYLYKKDGGKITSVTSSYNDYKHPVTATYTPGGAAPTTYSVNVTWGSMAFKYKDPDIKWNSNNHTYDKTGGGWTYTDENGHAQNTITVENHSNADVNVSFSFAGDNTYYVAGGSDCFAGNSENNDSSGSNPSIAGNSITLESAVGKNDVNGPTDPAKVTATLDLAGEMIDPKDSEAHVIGHVTVTIST